MFFFFSLSSDSIFCITSMSIGFQAWCLCWVPSCCSRFLESLCQALNSYLPKMSGFELLKVVYYLCLLGHFPSALLEQLLQANTLEQFNTTGNTKTKDFLFFSLFFFFFVCSFSLFFISHHTITSIWTSSISLQHPSFSIARWKCFRQWTYASVLTVICSLGPWLSPDLSWETSAAAVHHSTRGSHRACRDWWGNRQTQCYRRWWRWRTSTS